MQSIEAYKKFLLKFNKNDTNSNVNISKGEFVLIFNEQARKWLRDKIEQKQSSDKILDISELLVLDTPLVLLNSTDTSTDFTLPVDYFDYVSSKSIAKKVIQYVASDGTPQKQTCSRLLYNWNIKPKNVNTFLEDENNRPSFEFEETIITTYGGTAIKVYKRDFDISKIKLDYYKNPPQIDLAGYIKIDGSQSTNIDPIFTDVNTEQIINRCVEEATGNYQDGDGLTFAKQKSAKGNDN